MASQTNSVILSSIQNLMVLFYKVPNYVPDVHAPKVAAWVAAETTAGRYAPIHHAFARGFAALGVVDKDHSNMAKVRVVHELSRPTGTSSNLDISIEHCSLPSVRDAFNLLRPK
jgi:protein-S-isoprenylcysteine O-methyltransferase Ste14